MLLCSTNTTFGESTSYSNTLNKVLPENADWDLHLKCLSSNPAQPSLSTSTNIPKIPRIFHQTYKDLQIPLKYERPLRSLGAHHAIGSRRANESTAGATEYEYVFWSDASIMEFIASSHPEYLSLSGLHAPPGASRRDQVLHYVRVRWHLR